MTRDKNVANVLINVRGRCKSYLDRVGNKVIASNADALRRLVYQRSTDTFKDVTHDHEALHAALVELGLLRGASNILILLAEDGITYLDCPKIIDTNKVRLEDAPYNELPGVKEAIEKVAIVNGLRDSFTSLLEGSYWSLKELVTLLPATRHFLESNIQPYKRVPTHLYLRDSSKINAQIAQLHFLLNLEGV